MTDARRWNIAFAFAFLTLVGTAGIYYFYQVVPVLLAKPLSMLPMDIGGWVGQPADPHISPLRLGQADDELTRLYRNVSGDSMGLYIAYFRVQDGGKKLVDFRSRDLARNADLVEVLASGQPSTRIGRTLLVRNGRPWLVSYWFDMNGRIVPNRYMAKLYMLLDALWHRRTNGALVLVFSDPGTPGLAARSLPQETTFLGGLLPTVHAHLSSHS